MYDFILSIIPLLFLSSSLFVGHYKISVFPYKNLMHTKWVDFSKFLPAVTQNNLPAQAY